MVAAALLLATAAVAECPFGGRTASAAARARRRLLRAAVAAEQRAEVRVGAECVPVRHGTRLLSVRGEGSERLRTRVGRRAWRRIAPVAAGGGGRGGGRGGGGRRGDERGEERLGERIALP